MELLEAILPFFSAGIAGAAFARFTGVNMSMCMLAIYLYMGARPGEALAAMLVFNTFSYFTVYTQKKPMNFKSLRFFHGIRIAFPILVTVALAAINPFFGIAFFIAVFLVEIFAQFYQELPAKGRPTKETIIKMCVIASVLVALGVVVTLVIPPQFYYILAGVVVIAYVVLLWFAGDRRKWQNQWDGILYGSTFFTGLVGIDATDWLVPMQRAKESVLSRLYPVVINVASIVGMIVVYIVYQEFSIGSLFALIGASMVIRLFGLNEHSSRGKFSYLALGLALLGALVFMIIQPQPTHLPVIPVTESNGFFFGNW